jgi:hypothetical protein
MFAVPFVAAAFVGRTIGELDMRSERLRGTRIVYDLRPDSFFSASSSAPVAISSS